MRAIKTILVHAEQSDAGAELLSQAAALAATRDAHLVALVVGVEPTPAYASLPDIPPEGFFVETEEARQEVERTMGWVEQHLTRTGAGFEVRGLLSTTGEAGKRFARHARYADVAILPRGDDDSNWQRLVHATLLESGRPAIVCPPGSDLAAIGSRIVVAWDGGREAVRAVHECVHFAEKAEDVHIVTVDPQVSLYDHGEEPGADLAAMLARHGLPVTVDAIPRESQSVAEAIMRHADAVGADLIVSGAYGHWRISEIILGGVTRELLEKSQKPLLMAH